MNLLWVPQWMIFPSFIPNHDQNDRLFVAALTGDAAWLNVIDSNETIKDLFK